MNLKNTSTTLLYNRYFFLETVSIFTSLCIPVELQTSRAVVPNDIPSIPTGAFLYLYVALTVFHSEFYQFYREYKLGSY